MEIPARPRFLAATALTVLVVVVVFLVSSGGSSAPADHAVRLVPARAVAYVHISTDRSNDAVRRALDLARGFPAYRSVRSAVLGRLTGPGCGIGPKDMAGKEAAVAVVDSGALVLFDTGHDHSKAAPRPCGKVSAGYIGRFLAIGPSTLLAEVAELAKGKGKALDSDPDYRRARNGLPAGRFADGFVTADGLRGLLAPQAGLAGAAGVLLDRPGLAAVGFAAEARAPGARLTVHEVLDGKQDAATFHPTLLGNVPAGSLAAMDVRDLGSAVQRLGGLITGLGPAAQRRIADALKGEVVLWLTPASPAPRLTMLTPVANVHQGSLPQSFAGAPLYSAVLGDKLVASTDVSGISAVRHGVGKRLIDGAAYRSVLSGAPPRVTSLTFLDFSELLRLAEQTGLSNSRAYRRIRRDLGRVRAVGATSTGDADETTLQVELSIP